MLLHGWPQHWYEWREVIGPLAERYRVICPDLRGFGWSQAPPGGYEKETLADDVIALLEVLGLERVRLAGHDWGGFVGFLLCLRRPDLVERYLALNIIYPWPRLDPRGMLELWRPLHALRPQRSDPRPAPAPPRARRAAPRPRGGGGAAGHLHARRARRLRRPAPRAGASAGDGRAVPDLRPARAAGARARPLRRRAAYHPHPPPVRHRGLGISERMLRGFEDPDEMELELVPGVGHFIVDERGSSLRR